MNYTAAPTDWNANAYTIPVLNGYNHGLPFRSTPASNLFLGDPNNMSTGFVVDSDSGDAAESTPLGSAASPGGSNAPQHTWDSIRPIFTKLYQVDRLRLKDIMHSMERDYHFQAPEHAYKKRITEWGLRKAFTRTQKAQFALEAERRLAAGKSLPAIDKATGRPIPWDRVRRQEGSRLIPKEKLPHPTEKAFKRRTKRKCHPDSGAISGETTPASSVDLTELMLMTPTSQTLDSASSLSPITPFNLQRIEYMFHQVQDFYTWHRNLQAKTHRRTTLATVYQNAFRQIACHPSDDISTYLIPAANVVSMVLRQHPIGVLHDLLWVIAKGSRFLNPEQSLLLTRFIAYVCCQEYGADNPLSLLFRTIMLATKQVSSSPMMIYQTEGSIPITQLMKHSVVEMKGQDTPAIPGAQQDLIDTLFTLSVISPNRVPSEAYEVEAECVDSVSWHAEKYGDAHPLTMRAKNDLGRAYQAQNRLSDARNLLETQWEIWSKTHQDMDQLSIQQEIDWCPASDLAYVCGARGDLRASSYYRQQAFEYRLVRNGPTSSSTIYCLRQLVRILRAVGNYQKIEDLKEWYPESCQKLGLFDVVEEEAEDE